ncbi:MAG: hypothetical protein H6Q99_319 [Proteobacteria bacterium]|nr:hypothetical protein [Pseudomonadota bacterium]
MARQAPNWYVQQWKDGTTHEYQSTGFALKNTTTPPVKVVGDKLYFNKMGVGYAEEDVQVGDKATPMNPDQGKVELGTKKSRAFYEVYEDDLDQMTADERADKQKESAQALGRVHDRTIVGAVKSEAAGSVGAYAAGGSLSLLLQGRQALLAEDVPCEDGNVFCAVDSVTWSLLLAYEQFTNSQWVGPALPFVTGALAKTWNGIHVFQLSDKTLRMQDTASADAAGQATCLMWHKGAVGFGTVRDMTGDVAWDIDYDCWKHSMRMRIGSKLILPKGAVKLLTKYDATLISLI